MARPPWAQLPLSGTYLSSAIGRDESEKVIQKQKVGKPEIGRAFI